MSASEQALNWVQALIWPALIAVGVWVFRSQIRGLLDRIKSVKAAGVEVELGPVAEVLKASVEQTREEVTKAKDPQERARAVDKLQREAAALGRVEAAQEIGRGESIQAQRSGRADDQLFQEAGRLLFQEPGMESRLGRIGLTPWRIALLPYYLRVTQTARDKIRKERLPKGLTAEIQRALNEQLIIDESRGIPVEEVIARLGTPEQFVDAWIEARREKREPE